MPRKRKNLVFEGTIKGFRTPTVVAKNFPEKQAAHAKKGAIKAAKQQGVNLRIIETDATSVGYSKGYADAWEAFQKRKAKAERRKGKGKGGRGKGKGKGGKGK